MFEFDEGLELDEFLLGGVGRDTEGVLLRDGVGREIEGELDRREFEEFNDR